MSGAIPWDLLQSQYSSEPLIRDQLSKMVLGPNSGNVSAAIGPTNASSEWTYSSTVILHFEKPAPNRKSSFQESNFLAGQEFARQVTHKMDEVCGQRILGRPPAS